MAPGYGIGDTLVSSSRSSYFGAGVNDGTPYDPSVYCAGISVVCFVNVHSASAGKDWFGHLKTLKNDAALTGKVKFFVFAFRHDGANYLNVTSADVQTAINVGTITDEDFHDTPVVLDTNSLVAENHRAGIGSNPSVRDYWVYVTDKASLISDKWHTSCTSNDEPISFRHIVLGAYTGGFDSSDMTNTHEFLKQRILNLDASLRILAADPAAGSYINSSEDIAKLYFSRPLQDAGATTAANFKLSGGGIQGGASVDASSAAYADRDKAENAVALSFNTALDDSGPNDTVTLSVTAANVMDTSGGTLPGANTIDYTADISGPTPVLSFQPGSTSPTNAAVIQLILDFGEQVQSFQCNLIQVGNGSCTSAPDATPGRYLLDITPPPGFDIGQITVEVLAGAAQDSVGNPSKASAATFTIDYDKVKPAPVITVEAGGAAVNNGDTIEVQTVDVTVDFGEPLRAGDSLAAGNLTLSNCAIPGSIVADADNQVFSFQAQLNPNVVASLQVQANQLHDPAGNLNAASAAFLVTYVPAPVTDDRDILLLLDMSGSMNWQVTIEGTTQAKIAFMKPAILTFLNKLDAAVTAGTAKATDQVALVTYGSAAQVVQIAGSDLTALSGIAGVVSVVSGLMAGGSTAMGSGLANALHLLGWDQPGTRKRFIVMFADGQDNVAPLVQASELSYSIPAPGPGNTSGYPPGMAAVTVSASDPGRIPIYTIGITTEGYGDTSSWLDKLRCLSLVSGGQEWAMPGNQIWDDVETGLDEVITEVYAGSSPQVVHRSRGTLQPGEQSRRVPFVLDAGVRAIIVSASWPGAIGLRFTLHKEGHRFAGFDKTIRSAGSVVSALRFPAWVRFASAIDVLSRHIGMNWAVLDRRLACLLGRKIGAAGLWEIEVERLEAGSANPAPYSISVIAEERGLDLKIELPRRAVLTGSAVDVRLALFEKKVPVNAAKAAEVTVTMPRIGLGSVIKKYRSELHYEKGKTLEDSLRGLREALQKHPRAKAELGRSSTAVCKFSAVGGETGRYRARLESVRVPGLYRFDVAVLGQAAGVGAFQRRAAGTMLVLPAVSWKHSVLEERFDPRTGELEVLLEPKDELGNLLGPGYAHRIHTPFAEEKNLKVTDNLDGTYLVQARVRDRTLAEQRVLKITFYGRSVWKSAPARLRAESGRKVK